MNSEDETIRFYDEFVYSSFRTPSNICDGTSSVDWRPKSRVVDAIEKLMVKSVEVYDSRTPCRNSNNGIHHPIARGQCSDCGFPNRRT